MNNMLKRMGLSVLGLLQGALGSYLALLGFAFAFPGTTPGSKDYDEDMLFVPVGFVIMFIWLAVMITAIVLLRKNKANLLSFLISWLIGLGGFLVFLFIIN